VTIIKRVLKRKGGRRGMESSPREDTKDGQNCGERGGPGG